MDITKMSQAEKDELYRKLADEKAKAENDRKKAYEDIRSDFVARIKAAVNEYMQGGRKFKEWLRNESEAFYSVMKEYGKLNRADQLSFSVSDDNFKYIVKGSKVKGFDERADIAEKRLVDFLKSWVSNSENGVNNPMYKLAMMMIQRNEAGDLDYKSISRLYELENDFNSTDYSDIMQLFKESNIVEKTAIHFYFEEKDPLNKWKKIEPSFNRM